MKSKWSISINVATTYVTVYNAKKLRLKLHVSHRQLVIHGFIYDLYVTVCFNLTRETDFQMRISNEQMANVTNASLAKVAKVTKVIKMNYVHSGANRGDAP